MVTPSEHSLLVEETSKLLQQLREWREKGVTPSPEAYASAMKKLKDNWAALERIR